MFLHAPDIHGVSSPVDGLDGALPLMGSGAAPSATDTKTTSGRWLVDLRWVQTHVRREQAGGTELGVVDGKEAETRRGVAIFSEPVVLPGGSVVWHPVRAMPTETTATLEAVMSMCQRWRQEQDGASR